MIIWTGIDPGLAGAIVSHTSAGDYHVVDMPTVSQGKGRRRVDHYALHDLLLDLRPAIVGVELLKPRPNGVIAAFKTGTAWMAAEMAAYACGAQIVQAAPAEWKSHFGLDTKVKEDARVLANRTLGDPEWLRLKKHVDRADAFWIGRYAYERRI